MWPNPGNPKRLLMQALIIANGDLPDMKRMTSILRRCDVIVCADGGANAARKRGITPDVILGDLDSISSSTKKFFQNVPLLHIDDQYSTDLEKAISYCVKRKYKSISIVGMTGSRIDHTTASLGCFKKFRGQIELQMYDREGEIVLLEKKTSLVTRKGEKISLIPLERCTGVTTKNLFYSLKNETLELGVREGISNIATARRVTVSYKAGILLLYRFYE